MALNRFDAILRAASTVDFSFRQRYTSPSTTAQQASAMCFGHLDSLKREKFLENRAQLTDTLLQSGPIVVQICVYWVQRNVRVRPSAATKECFSACGVC
jgi:hypothetical protein